MDKSKDQFFTKELDETMENHQTLGETFLLKASTKDGYPVIIGGISRAGTGQESIEAYEKIKTMEIGDTKDEYIIDCILADAVLALSPTSIIVVAATISIKDVQNRTGGIIGNPFSEHQSAQKEIEEMIPGLFLLSFPGGPGVAFQGTYEDGVMIQNMIIGNESEERILRKMEQITPLYLWVTDGSGPDSRGGIVAYSSNQKMREKFLEKQFGCNTQ